MPRTGSHWDSKLFQIKEMAGKVKAQEIADRLGVSVGSLYVFCSSKGISLRVPRKFPEKKTAQQKKATPAVRETRAAVLAGLVADLFDIDTSNSPDPVADVIRFLKHKLNT
jgi:AcrR family transcriptional regulator